MCKFCDMIIKILINKCQKGICVSQPISINKAQPEKALCTTPLKIQFTYLSLVCVIVLSARFKPDSKFGISLDEHY